MSIENRPQNKNLRVEIFKPREDGLVYSSDGKNIMIQEGLDSELEAIADFPKQRTVKKGTELVRVNSQDIFSATIFNLNLERILYSDSILHNSIQARFLLLKQIREIQELDLI